MITIYAQERDDGIAAQIQAKASFVYSSPLVLLDKARQEEAKRAFALTTASHQVQSDLFYLDTILATTGWNLNDDIFTKSVLWAARHSAEDKPFNYNHDQSDIIGHITAGVAVDADYKVIADDSVLDDVPDKFHIKTAAVIYRAYENKERSERIEKLISEIKDDKWHVSMECLLYGFDYALLSESGTKRIVARNEDTAFLSKYLRAYGGKGKYGTEKIGRVLSSIAFCGKGLVERPANPESIIFNKIVDFSVANTKVFQDLLYNKEEAYPIISNGADSMPDTDTKLSDAQKSLEVALASNAELNKKLDTITAEAAKATNARIEALTVARDEAVAAKESAEAKLTEAEKAASAAKDEAKLEKEKAEKAKAGEEAMKKTLDEYKKASKVSKAGASEDEATAFIAKYSKLDDETFADVLDLAKAGFAANKAEAPATATATSVVETAVEPAKASVATAGENTETERAVSGLSDFLAKNVTGGKRNRKNTNKTNEEK